MCYWPKGRIYRLCGYNVLLLLAQKPSSSRMRRSDVSGPKLLLTCDSHSERGRCTRKHDPLPADYILRPS